MNVQQAKNLARAIELDDPYPPNICPGCRRPLHHTEYYDCPWNHLYYGARRFRRAYIAKYTAVAS